MSKEVDLTFFLPFFVLIMKIYVSLLNLLGPLCNLQFRFTNQSFFISTFFCKIKVTWHQIHVLTKISIRLTSRLTKLVRFKAWSSIKRFTTASTKFSKIAAICFVLGAKNGPKNKSNTIKKFWWKFSLEISQKASLV